LVPKSEVGVVDGTSLRHIQRAGYRLLRVWLPKVLVLCLQVPSYFTNAQRRALLQATTIAGLDVKMLLNDSTAAALAYYNSRKSLLETAEPTWSENVFFIDVGHTCAQVFCASISKDGVKVLLDARGL
jgi:hypothetical protein